MIRLYESHAYLAWKKCQPENVRQWPVQNAGLKQSRSSQSFKLQSKRVGVR